MKSLALPLLQRDLQNARETFRNDVKDIKAEVDRIYDFNKWFMALMFTVALGVFGLALNNLSAGRAKERPQVPTDPRYSDEEEDV